MNQAKRGKREFTVLVVPPNFMRATGAEPQFIRVQARSVEQAERIAAQHYEADHQPKNKQTNK